MITETKAICVSNRDKVQYADFANYIK